MRFSRRIKFFNEGGINIPLDKELPGTSCYVSIGQGTDGRRYMVLSLYTLPSWYNYSSEPLPIIDGSSTAIVELKTTTDSLYEAIKYDEFAKILVTADNTEGMSPDTVFNIYHDALAYRHAYIARENTDIARAVDKYNARKFLNEYRNLILNTNGYGTSEEEKAPYLRFIDGEKGAFSVLREL